jgi:hypothetical protein
MTGHAMTWLRLPRPLLWVLIALAAMLITYAAFRGYLQPELLIGFANTFTC